ncbi:MAG: hypothetical protein FWD68_12315 [Alphaproteobacteria bacterium]|nr:hypothetical protein [Alphaproteobacteria bacterium]
MPILAEEIVNLSRRKILFVVVAALLLAGIGAWLIFLDDDTILSARRFHMPWFIHFVGIITVLFFGACAAYGIRKLLDTSAGFIFNASGFIDNSISVGNGTVPWSEIVGTEEVVISMQRMLVVKLRDPEKFLEPGWGLREIIKKAAYKSYNSPVILTSTLLDIDFASFVSMFERYRQTCGNR